MEEKRLIELKYIGPYLSRRFAAQNIQTLGELVTQLKEINSRSEINRFLAQILQNRRKGLCVPPNQRRAYYEVPQGFGRGKPGKYQYCIRNVNAYGWQAIAKALRKTSLPRNLLPPLHKPRTEFCPPSYCYLGPLDGDVDDDDDFGGDDFIFDDDDDVLPPMPPQPLLEPEQPPAPKRPKQFQRVFGMRWDIGEPENLRSDMSKRFRSMKVVAGGQKKRRKRPPTPREKKKAIAVYTSGILNGNDAQLTWPVLQLLVQYIGFSPRYQSGPRRGQMKTKCELARTLVRAGGMGTRNWQDIGPQCRVPEFQEPVFPKVRTYKKRK
jgi:hypothetical protein